MVFSKKAACQQTVLAFNKDTSVCCAISHNDEGQLYDNGTEVFPF
jgi:hypothetical protein